MNLVLNEDFIDVTTSDFADENRSGLFLNFLAQSLVRIIKPMINPDMVDEALIELKDSMIKCNLPGLNIYANHTLNEIAKAYVNDYRMTTKIIVKYQDKLFSIDMKTHNGYIILANANDTIELEETKKARK